MAKRAPARNSRPFVFPGGIPDDRPRYSRPGHGPARQRPASPPGCRVARRAPRPAHGRRDRQRPRPLGRRGRQRADYPGRPGRGQPHRRQAAALRGQLRDRRRSRSHHPQGTLAAQGRPCRAAGRPEAGRLAITPGRAEAGRRASLAGLAEGRRPFGQAWPGDPPWRAGLPAARTGRHGRCRGAAHAARRGSPFLACRSARHGQDEPGRGGLPRPDHGGRRRRHHGGGLRGRVHPAARRHVRVHLRAADQGHAGGPGAVHRRRDPHLAGGAGGRLPRDVLT